MATNSSNVKTVTFNGDTYVCKWKDDMFKGQGTHTWGNGNKYVGEFKEGKYNGLVAGDRIDESSLRFDHW